MKHGGGPLYEQIPTHRARARVARLVLLFRPRRSRSRLPPPLLPARAAWGGDGKLGAQQVEEVHAVGGGVLEHELVGVVRLPGQVELGCRNTLQRCECSIGTASSTDGASWPVGVVPTSGPHSTPTCIAAQAQGCPVVAACRLLGRGVGAEVALVALALGVLDPAGRGAGTCRVAQRGAAGSGAVRVRPSPDVRLPLPSPLVLGHANLRHRRSRAARWGSERGVPCQTPTAFHTVHCV